MLRWLILLFKPVRVHRFIKPDKSPMPDTAPSWIGYCCEYCHHVFGLDAWQIKKLSVYLAVCEKGRKLSFWEKLLFFINGFK